MPFYELVKGRKKRFWSITKTDDELIFEEGRIGFPGERSTQLFYDREDMQRQFDAKIATHEKAGYVRRDPGPLPGRGKGALYLHPEGAFEIETVRTKGFDWVDIRGQARTQICRNANEVTARLETLIAEHLSQGFQLAPKPRSISQPKAAAKKRKPAAKPKPAKGLVESITRAKAWMTANGADVLVKNLKKGATDAAIARVEKRLGFAIPAELKQLWKLHDGQKTEQNGFIGSKDLLSIEEAILFRNDLLVATQRVIDDEAGGAMKPAERDDHWLPFAARDRDMLAVHATTGRVFEYWEDFTVASKTVTAWFESYANGIERGEYAVEEGFGDVYLSAV